MSTIPAARKVTLPLQCAAITGDAERQGSIDGAASCSYSMSGSSSNI